ncbi:hypothetical protein C8034_v011853 [Colletotrichum sidae]|uniref:Uncharacterized protein n=1 Tax=Colletotrichum sidae TaxID=1347389 RepID=A0A4R8TGY3_9PEZI|nr:hypothetical protein C8034_v011853 [Colletotrichum sidae]
MYSRTATLSPLPTVLREGMTAVVGLAGLSIVASSCLLIYLSGRLAAWYFRSSPENAQRIAERADAAGLPHEVSAQYFGGRPGRRARRTPNQALVLVLNVLAADLLQACAFFLDIVWLVEDRITDVSPACWAQGWFISTGDLASTTFIAAIAVHTYFTLVRGCKISNRVFYGSISFMWFFVLLMSILGVIITNDGADVGGFYVRDVTWCWINDEYGSMRIGLHYVWMLFFIVIGTVSYIMVFIHVHRLTRSRRPSRPSRHPAKSVDDVSDAGVVSPTTTAPPSPRTAAGEEIKSELHKRMLFLLYPVIFVLCTAPLALGRVMSSGGVRLSPEYLCFAGAMITSNGWLDVLVFSTTRRAILFDASPDEQNLGLDTFGLAHMGQHYGHRVWITGGPPPPPPAVPRVPERKPSVFRKPSRRPPRHRRRASAASRERSDSQTSLNGLDVAGLKGIQMETVTRVFVEVDRPSSQGASSTHRDLSSMPSVESSRWSRSVKFEQPYDDDTITVYQAYNADIATAAVEKQRLNASPAFKLTRMTWVKPSWAWMLYGYRCGYSYKDRGQERILALKMTHQAFVALLRKGVLSHGIVERGRPEVRIQWDPERDVRLGRLDYRSIQIGIPAGICQDWVEKGIVEIEDVTERARGLKRVLDEQSDVTDEDSKDMGLIPCEREFAVPKDVKQILHMDD